MTSEPTPLYSADDQTVPLFLPNAVSTKEAITSVEGEMNPPLALTLPQESTLYSHHDRTISSQLLKKSLSDAYSVPLAIEKLPIRSTVQKCQTRGQPPICCSSHAPSLILNMPMHLRAFGISPTSQCSNDQSDENISSLSDQLQLLMEEKANLEGQLETVILECQATLKERADLQSKLAKVEVDLRAHHNTPYSSPSTSFDQKDTDLSTRVTKMESALSQKRQELSTLNCEIEREKARTKQLIEDIVASQELIQVKEHQLSENAASIMVLSNSLKERTDTIQILKGQIASLQSRLESTDLSKSWLYDQLQDAIESKSKVQDQLRSIRTNSISQSIKLDVAHKENCLLQQQLHEIQKNIIKDKSKLVSELEVIEADVLSKENLYAELQSDKEHLQQQIHLKTTQLDQLTSQLVEQTSTASELQEQLADACKSLEKIEAQLKCNEEENTRLCSGIQHQKLEVASKDNEIADMKQVISTIQQQLQQAEATLISKEGALQGVRDSCNILKYELNTIKEAKSTIESELDSLQGANSKLEADNEKLENLVNKLSKELHLKQILMEKQLDHAQSQSICREIQLPKNDQFQADFEAQSEHPQDQLQSMFQTKSGTKSEEDLVAQLLKQKDELQQEVNSLKALEADLTNKVEFLEMQNAHLQGKLQSTVESGHLLDEFKHAFKEKNDLEKQLASEKLLHQQELIKLQAKIARLDTELKDITRESQMKEMKLKDELISANKQIDEVMTTLGSKSNNSNTVEYENTEILHANEKENEHIKDLESTNSSLWQENLKLINQLHEKEKQFVELKQASEMLSQNIREEGQKTIEELEKQNQKLTYECEHLKGRLAGTNITQQCLREHAASIENSLSQKEAQLHQLALETSSMLFEKDQLISELNASISILKDSESYLKSELEQALTESLMEKQRADDTQRELAYNKEELPSNSKQFVEEVNYLEQENNDLKAEVHVLKQQLAVAQAITDSYCKDLQEKITLGDLLQEQLKLAEKQFQNSQSELIQLQEHLKKPIEISSSSLLYTSGFDEKHADSSKEPTVVGENAQKMVSGEMSLLKSQLGSKSKTLTNLQSCLQLLKDDMGRIQSNMDEHSFSLQQSYRSSQDLENKIQDLERRRSNCNT